MEISNQNYRKTVKRACLMTAIIAGVGYALLSFLLHPLFIQWYSDKPFYTQYPFIVDLLRILVDEGVFNVVICIFCYPFTVYAIWRTGLKKSWSVMVLFAGLDLLRFVANFFMTAVSNGALPSAEEFWEFDIFYISSLFVLDLLPYICVVLCAILVRALWVKKLEAEAFQAEKKSIPHPLEGLLPLKGIFRLNNPLQLSAFLAGVILCLLRFSDQFIYELTQAVSTNENLGIFALIVITDLLLNLFLGALLYFSILYISSRMHQKGF